MDTDWWARGIAIGGAVIAATAFVWNIISWRHQGPVIKVRATCSGRGAEMKIAAHAYNAGRFDSFLAGATLHWRSAAEGTSGATSFSCDVPAGYVPGLPTWKTELPAQEPGLDFDIVNLRELDPGLELALHERRWAKLVLHTASGQKAGAMIRYGRA